jgi:hypothetical protein
MQPLYHKPPVKLILKIGAFLFPLFFIYGPFNDEENNAVSQQVWRYIIAGLVFDVAALMLLMYFSIL